MCCRSAGPRDSRGRPLSGGWPRARRAWRSRPNWNVSWLTCGRASARVRANQGGPVMDEFRKWRIGDVTVTRVVEVGNVTVPASVILPKATAADVTAEGWLSPNYADEAGNIIVNFQGFLIEAGGRKIM